jgi:hypothetical protein
VITITHTHGQGTLVEGTERGDGSAQILKREGFRWSRNLGCWYRPNSRDRDARRLDIVQEALGASGIDSELSIDNTRRATAEVQADRLNRSAQRAHGLAEKAQRLDARATEEFGRARSDEDATGIPFGQPILVGHHSERRHRATIERADRAMRRGVEASREAEGARNGAAAAAANLRRADDPAYIGNRIEEAERDLRAAQRGYRRIDGTTTGPIARRVDEATERLAYWKGELERVQEQLGVKVYTRADLAVGDMVRVKGYWGIVAKLNPKTVAVTCNMPWPLKYGYHEVKDHKPGTDETRKAVAA